MEFGESTVNLNALLAEYQISPLALLIFPVVLMLVVSGLLAWFGGWRDLVKVYPAQAKPAGEVFRLRSVRLRKWRVPTNYNNCVTIILGDAGLYLGMPFFFRFQHDPILIPWQQIERAETEKHWYGRYVTLFLRSCKVRVHLPGKIGEQVAARLALRHNAADFSCSANP